MKRICSVFIALVLVLTVTGCGLDTNKKSDKVSIVTTMFAAYDFAREIAGDRADITLLLKPGADSHSYEPSPKDMATSYCARISQMSTYSSIQAARMMTG